MRLHLALVCLFAGCTAVNFAAVPAMQQTGLFITSQDIAEPYESVGIVQVTRRGVLLFGWADPAGTDLNAAVAEVEGQVRFARADGLINVKVQQTNYTTAQRILGAIFFFAPLPAEVTITGELVRLKRAPAMPPPLPATGAPL